MPSLENEGHRPMKFPRRSSLFAGTCLSLALLAAAPDLLAENWPRWRGPNGNGISGETKVPVEWSRSENVAWRLPLPGPAGSTPVVWEDRIFLTSAEGEDLILMCISTDGDEIWRRTLGTGNRSVMRGEGNAASPSPSTDGRHVWAFVGTGDLACFDFDGNTVWRTNLQDRYGKFQIQFGMTSTPLLAGDRLYLQLIHGDRDPDTREALVVALDKRTGEEIWKRQRVTDAYNENEHSYASPVLYDDGDLKLLLTHGADYVIAHRLQDGREVWRFCLNPQDNPDLEYHPTLRFVASPATAPGIVVVPTAKERPVVALRPDFEGDLSDSAAAHLWTYRETPDVPSPLIHEGLVYLCEENGNLHCLDAETGRVHYRKRTHRARHRASPIYADGKIYLTARDGKVTVVRAGPQFEKVAENDLEEEIAASPVVSNGTLYLRSFEALWAIREK